MTLLKCLHVFAMLLLLVSCTHYGKGNLSDPKHDPTPFGPTQGGRLSKGPGYFLEVVGGKDQIKIFPSKLNIESSTLEPTALSHFAISAFYHYTCGPKVMKTGMRTCDVPVKLMAEENYFYGNINIGEMNEYWLVLDINYLNTDEKYVFNFTNEGT